MKSINIILVFLSIIYIIASESKSNQQCLLITNPESTCTLDHDENLSLQNILDVINNTNISILRFKEYSNGSEGNRFLKDNYLSIANEINSKIHFTKFEIYLFILSEEADADFLDFINLVENKGQIKLTITVQGSIQEMTKIVEAINFTDQFEYILVVPDESVVLPQHSYTEVEYATLQTKFQEKILGKDIATYSFWARESYYHILYKSSFEIYSSMPPHMPQTEEYYLQFFIQNLISFAKVKDQTSRLYHRFAEYTENNRVTAIVQAFINEDGNDQYFTINEYTNSGTTFYSGVKDFIQKIAYAGHKIYLCPDGYVATKQNEQYTFSCENSQPPIKNQITASDCTGSQTEKHVIINSNNNCFKESDLQECYRYMGQLQDPILSADPSYKEVDTVCTTSTWNSVPTIKVSLTYTNWKLSVFNIPSSNTNQTPYTADISDCKFSRKLYASSECNYGEDNCNKKDDGNFKQLGIQWGNEIDTEDGSTINTEEFDKVYSDSLDSYFIHLKIADLAAGNISYCFENTVLSASTGDFVFQCFFVEDILMYGVPQHSYAFDVQITIDRDTSASKSLDVTKTLVQGNCCKNSFGITSQLHFCSTDVGATCVKGDNDIVSIQRNTVLIAVWSIVDDATSAAIKSFAFLFPDVIKIGPFLPDWVGYIADTGRTAASSHWQTPSDSSSFAIQIQSNVAFSASVTFTGRLWEKSQYGPDIAYPHTCFIKDGQNDPSGCTAFTSTTRRTLQEEQPKYGSPESQMQVSSPIVFVEEDNNKDTQNNKSKNSSDNDGDNIVLIVVVVSLVIVLIIGGIVAGICYMKSKNQKQKNSEQEEKYHAKETNA